MATKHKNGTQQEFQITKQLENAKEIVHRLNNAVKPKETFLLPVLEDFMLDENDLFDETLQQEAIKHGTTIAEKREEMIQHLNFKLVECRPSLAENLHVENVKEFATLVLKIGRFTGQDSPEEIFDRYIDNFGIMERVCIKNRAVDILSKSNMPQEQYCREIFDRFVHYYGAMESKNKENKDTETAVPNRSLESLEKECREKWGYVGETMSSFIYGDRWHQRRKQIKFDIFPFIPVANKSKIKTINIVAGGGTGKTWTMCDWALHYIHGKTLFNDKENRLPVFNKEDKGVCILSLEEGDEIQGNLDRIDQGMIDKGIITKEEAKQKSNRLVVICGSDRWFFELDKEGKFNHLEDLCKSHHLGWICIDSGSVYSAEFGAGNNNDNIQMYEVYKPVYAIAKKYELNIIILNHIRKKYDWDQWTTMTQDDLIGASFQANISCSIIGIWTDPKNEDILNYKLLKCNGLRAEIRDRIYRVRRSDGEFMPYEGGDTDEELIGIPEEIRNYLNNEQTMSFDLEEIKSQKEMKEKRNEKKHEKTKTYEENMKILCNMYIEMGQGSQTYIAKFANEHKNEKGEYDMKTKTGKEWTADNLLDKIKKYREENNLPLPTHSYKDYLANKVDTSMKADEGCTLD